MQSLHNILLVSRGLGHEDEAVERALRLAREKRAALTALVVCPALPEAMAGYQAAYEAALSEQLSKAIEAARGSPSDADGGGEITVQVDSGDRAALRIVRRVIRDGHDLLIKEAQPPEDRKGFRALDMELLRKCPCPVWLCRPAAGTRREPRVAVAIDAQSEEPAGRDLALRLLAVASSLAGDFGGELSIISCWECELEPYLLHNPWGKVSREEVQKTVEELREAHRAALHALIRESGIGTDSRVYHVRGRAETMIPTLIVEQSIDLLVMGTVGRTGIAGFLLGNTAEDVLQELHCSLLALKPEGFVSPVKVS